VRAVILVVNAGSSSIKIELFDATLVSAVAGSVTEIGSAGVLKLGADRQEIRTADHVEAFARLLEGLETQGHPVSTLHAAGHRIVHGGPDLTDAKPLIPDVIARIKACNALAPLHNPHNLSGIHALKSLAPDLPQFASFDTAFHATNDALATTYAIPEAARAEGMRRYGFHGLSYAGLVASFGGDLPERLLAFHLGNGASLCAIKDGRSVASSMGYSPLDGLVMGTRSGAIDGMAVLRLAETHGIAGAADLLNKQSGLKALAGTSDMADLLARDDAEARFAVDMFCYWAARQAGSALVALGGLDAVAFTGGIGENAPLVRDKIMAHLAWLGHVPVHVVKAEEERQIARDVARLLAARK
jgi:acetate kinase